MTLTAELPATSAKPRKFAFTKENSRLYQERAAILRRNRRDSEALTEAIESKANERLPEISGKVRGNLAMMLLRQSSLLSALKVKNYDHVVGSKGKVGLMEALASLADSAAKVFQWSQEQNTQLISIGSFVQVNQAPASVPNLSQNQQVIDITQQTDVSGVGSEPMPIPVPVPVQGE